MRRGRYSWYRSTICVRHSAATLATQRELCVSTGQPYSRFEARDYPCQDSSFDITGLFDLIG